MKSYFMPQILKIQCRIYEPGKNLQFAIFHLTKIVFLAQYTIRVKQKI